MELWSSIPPNMGNYINKGALPHTRIFSKTSSVLHPAVTVGADKLNGVGERLPAPGVKLATPLGWESAPIFLLGVDPSSSIWAIDPVISGRVAR
jgi:hypothetical protein